MGDAASVGRADGARLSSAEDDSPAGAHELVWRGAIMADSGSEGRHFLVPGGPRHASGTALRSPIVRRSTSGSGLEHNTAFVERAHVSCSPSSARAPRPWPLRCATASARGSAGAGTGGGVSRLPAGASRARRRLNPHGRRAGAFATGVGARDELSGYLRRTTITVGWPGARLRQRIGRAGRAGAPDI